MKRGAILILVGMGLLLIPIVGRALWFYRGSYQPPDEIALPAFSEITIPQPPVGEARSLPDERPAPISSVVLVDAAHSNRFDISELETLTRALSARGAAVQVLDSNAEFDELGLEGRLKFVNAFVVVAPFESFTASEVESVRRFVERDGRLLVILDPTRSSSDAELFGFNDDAKGGDVAAANQLLEPLDLAFSNDYLYDLVENEGNFRNVFFEIFNESPLTKDLATLTMYAARSVYTEAGTPLVLGGETVFSSTTDTGGGLSVAALSPNEGALALGDLTFLQPPYDNVTDNRQFIDNLADYLIAGDREVALEDLPFVFTGPVALVQSGDFSLQAETLSALQAVKGTLRAAGIMLIFPEEPAPDGDRLVLGLFEPDPDLEDYLAPLEITLPSDDPDGLLHVPGFGALNPAGIGVVGVVRDEGGTTLVLLAEDEERLVSLLESMSSDLLEGCLVQGAYGLCKVGEGEGFGAADELEFDLDFEEAFSD
ncbi:MAG: hypothetical protein BMS9Abin28_1018 [Anaerolineae bacterium]|nr:MAG: hypothetical protein BMS9Abin28_1018 [Anaerolineae bacterium]